MRNSQGSAAGRSVELCHHQSRYGYGLGESPGLRESILPNRRVEDEQRLVGRAWNSLRNYSMNLLELVHQA